METVMEGGEEWGWRGGKGRCAGQRKRWCRKGNDMPILAL